MNHKDSRSDYLFPAAFRPCSITKIQRPLKTQKENGGKPEIFDFVGAPLPRRLEGFSNQVLLQSMVLPSFLRGFLLEKQPYVPK
ncbi:hypothetical protein AB3329_01525 [Streptococcus sp. H31]|uniref:hypothetical protein n=1 Tax=Streptococcus huangxiaojuni TaxID=3237239 RepID=UPI0034A3DDA2